MTALDYWTGEGGNEYIVRNGHDPQNLTRRAAMWERVLDRVNPINQILEVGANIGSNILALRNILPPHVQYYAIEPNDIACLQLLKIDIEFATNASADDIPLPDKSMDVVLTCGVLIHIEPEKLFDAMREMHRVANRYIIIAEYFSERPETHEYRGSFIWKRDFGKFFLDHFDDLRPVDCGFEWRYLTGLDNLTWWVFEKC